MGTFTDKENKDHILPEGLRDCSVSDFETFFRTYYRELYYFAYGYVMDEMEADDVVQGVFSDVWEIRGRLARPLNIKAYLYTSVKHACLRYFQRFKITDEYKSRQAEALLFSFAAGEPDECEDEVVVKVRKAMENLTQQQIRIVEMHIFNGLTYQEIASQLELSDNTVRTHLKRAYKILREHLSCLLPGLPLFCL